MKRLLLPAFSIFFCIALITVFGGCMKDKIRYTYQISTPVYEVLTSFRASIKSVAALPISNPGKIAVFGKYIFVSDNAKGGIHIIDNSSPSSPQNISFINIPGNQDFSIRGNALYADCYGDLVSFDITDPTNVVARNFAFNVFPDNSIYIYSGTTVNPDSINVIVNWVT